MIVAGFRGAPQKGAAFAAPTPSQYNAIDFRAKQKRPVLFSPHVVVKVTGLGMR
jgi:hypothetical protein